MNAIYAMRYCVLEAKVPDLIAQFVVCSMNTIVPFFLVSQHFSFFRILHFIFSTTFLQCWPFQNIFKRRSTHFLAQMVSATDGVHMIVERIWNIGQ